MAESQVKVLVPKGYKRCPKCKNLVKGPRTKVCTHDGCGHEFQPKNAAKAKPAKPSKAAKPTKIEKATEAEIDIALNNPTLPCPYTTSEIVMLNQRRTLPYYKNGKVVKKVSMITRSNVIGPKDYKQNQVDLAMRKVAEAPTEYGIFPSEVVYT